MKNKKLLILLATEIAELFGRFGIASILIFYLTQTLHQSDAAGFAIYASFAALLFMAPLLGGFLMDHFLDKRHAIVAGAFMMAAGQFLLFRANLQQVYLWPVGHCDR